MTLGTTPSDQSIFATTTNFCASRISEDSIYSLLHRECTTLFPDQMFADLFEDVGRRSVPPRIVAVVMILQRIEGLSDRDAVERFTYDIRWKYAAGGLDFDYPGFVHTVLVDMRARLGRSSRPERIFEVTLGAAKAAGLVGRRRVLDSTPLYDAVATMDTITLIRSAIRQVLQAADGALLESLRQVITAKDGYESTGKPQIDWDDALAREALIDSRAKDGFAILSVLDGEKLGPVLTSAATLLATVLGQDLEETSTGTFRIARRVAKDRIISTVDTEARHGHKTSHRHFDGYKGHIVLDPDSEIITATGVTPGNTGDACAATDLLSDVINDPGSKCSEVVDPKEAVEERDVDHHPDNKDTNTEPEKEPEPDAQCQEPSGEPYQVYGDAAYGSGELLHTLEQAGAEIYCKVQPPVAVGGRFTKDAFGIDLQASTVTCPNGHIVHLRETKEGRLAKFAKLCTTCPVASQCTTSRIGRNIRVCPYEEQLARARSIQATLDWKSDYRSNRPKVERKFAHLMRHRHGGRRARVRGQKKVAADFNLLAAAVNLARLARLRLIHDQGIWAINTV